MTISASTGGPATALEGASGEVTVTRTRHGPFERISVAASAGRRRYQLSLYRVGDLLVDAGGARGAAEVAALMRDDPPRRIVLTHQHEDHAGGVAALRRAWGHVPVHAPEAHVAYLRERDELAPYRIAAWGRPEPIPDAIAYDRGTVFEAGGVVLEAVPTPGHTPGHMSLVARVDGVRHVLAGDLYVGRRPLAAWYESAADALIHSWRALAVDPFRLLPTHGKVRDDGARVLAEVAEAVERASERVLDVAARLGTTDPAVVGVEALGPEDPHAVVSRGELSHAAFARSVLDPVRSLPASPVRVG